MSGNLPILGKLLFLRPSGRYLGVVSKAIPSATERVESFDGLRKEIARKDERIQYLEDRIKWFERQTFGTTSEKLVDPSGTASDLFGHDGQVLRTIPAHTVAAQTKVVSGHGRAPIPENLPREVRVLDLPESEKLCACCGLPMCQIGVESSEQLHLTSPRLWVLRTERPKYACPACPEEGVKIVAVPESFIDKGLAGLDLILWIVISKWVDHLPLYRIRNQIKRWGHGLDIAESTMIGWIAVVFELLGPIQQAMEHEIRSTGWMHLDETHLRVQLDEENKVGRGVTSTCYLWAMVGRDRVGEPQGVSFHYEDNRRTESAVRILDGFEGVVMTDGYQVYDGALAVLHKNAVLENKHLPRVVHAFCWAHARRKFNDALETGHKPAREALDLIASIYRAEKLCQARLVTCDGDIDQREEMLLAARAELLAVAIDAFFLWVRTTHQALQPQVFKGALFYATNHEEGLRVILSQAGCELDNNIVERAIRPVAIGRKNWLFAGSENGAERLACLLSILGTCKLLGIDPNEYLLDVLMKAKARRRDKNADVSDLTPARWLRKKSQPTA